MNATGTLYTALRSGLCGAFVAAVIILWGGTPASAQNFDYRAINLVTGSGGIDVHFLDLPTPTIKDIPFSWSGQVAPNLQSQDGAFTVKYTPTGAGLGSAFVEGGATVQSGYIYTGIAYGTTASPKLKIIDRNKNQAPPANRALLRVMHAASVNIPLDIHLGQVSSPPILASVAPDQATPFVNVAAEATTLIITEAGKQTPLARLTAPLGAGTSIVTLIITGSSANTLAIYALFDQDDSRHQLLPLEESSYTNVRVVHLRPGVTGIGEPVDVYLNKAGQSDFKVSDTLKYRRASRDFGPLFTDSFQVKFVPSGESPLNSLLTVNRRFYNDSSYIVVYTQFKDRKTTPIVLGRSPVEPLPPGLGTTKVRFVNATEFYGPLTAVVRAGTDTFRFENVAFRGFTEFRNLPVGAPLSIEVYRAGITEPFYTGISTTGAVPASAYLTFFAFGNNERLSVDILNESQSGLQPLASFDDPSLSVPQEEVQENLVTSLFPNPAIGETRLQVALDRAGDVKVLLYNGIGQEVMVSSTGHHEAGNLSLPLPLSSLPAGHYLCLVQVNGETLGRTPLLLVR